MKNVVIKTNKENGRTLIVRVNEQFKVTGCTPYVVAWCYNAETDDWMHGHYFEDIDSALAYLNS